MQHSRSADSKTVQICGQAVEKIITTLAAHQPVEITFSDACMKLWGFPNISVMRMTLEELHQALPEQLRKLLSIKEDIP